MSNYPDLDKKHGKQKVARVRRQIKAETGNEPSYVELLARLQNA